VEEVAEMLEGVGSVPALGDLVMRAVHAAEPRLRAAGLAALGERKPLPASEVAQVAREALKDKEADVRRAAATLLATLGKDEEADLLALLGDEDYEVRAIAARALGSVPSRASVDALLRALGTEGGIAVVQALARLGEQRAARPLLEKLSEDTPPGHEAERVTVIEALGALRAPEAAGALGSELWHPHPSVRLAAARALAMLPRNAWGESVRDGLEAHTADADKEVREACVQALAGAPTGATMPPGVQREAGGGEGGRNKGEGQSVPQPRPESQPQSKPGRVPQP